MAQNSKIEWTHHTFNPWRGCTKVSAGCANCYAETLSGRNPKTLGVWGPNGTRVVASETMWREPAKWDRKAKEAGERHRVFCASLADVFDDWSGPMVDAKGRQLVHIDGWDSSIWHPMDRECLESASGVTMADVRLRLCRLFSTLENLDLLLLTKRPENVLPMLDRIGDMVDTYEAERLSKWFIERVWLGVSVENQEQADKRIPILLKTPAAVRFLSMEPLLGNVDVSRWLNIRWQCSGCQNYFSGPYQKNCPGCGKSEYWSGSHAFNGRHRPPNDTFPSQTGSGIDWVIVGGESGPNARRMCPDWVRSIRDQCQAAGVPFFFKQWGEWRECDHPDQWESEVPEKYTIQAAHGTHFVKLGKRAAGRLLDGREHNEFPVA